MATSNFEKTLSRIMTERNLSVIEIAEAAGVERQSVYNWLEGAKPRALPLQKLCKFLKLSESELLYGQIEFNKARLVEVIDLVEQAADKNDVKLTSSKKAKLITLLYQRHADGQPLPHT